MLVSLLVLLFSTMSESANILMLHPVYCGSHEFLLRNMGDQLVGRGHEVTQVRGKKIHAGLTKTCAMSNKTEIAALSASRRREKLTWLTKITLDDKADDYLPYTGL